MTELQQLLMDFANAQPAKAQRFFEKMPDATRTDMRVAALAFLRIGEALAAAANANGEGWHQTIVILRRSRRKSSAFLRGLDEGLRQAASAEMNQESPNEVAIQLLEVLGSCIRNGLQGVAIDERGD